MAIDIQKSLSDISGKASEIQKGLSQFQKPEDDLSRKLTEALPSFDESKIRGAASESRTLLQKYTDLNKQRIESEGKTAIGEERELQEQKKKSELSAREGFGTNISAVRELEKTGQKRIAALEKAQNDALMSNQMESARNLSDLRFKEEELVTTGRQNFFSNLLGLAGFETPQKKRERELQSTQQQNLETLRTNYSDVPGVIEATSMSEMLKLVGPRLSEDRKLKLAQDDADTRYKEAQIQYMNAQKNKINNDLNSGVLDATDLTRIDNSPQGKKLRALNELKISAQRYQIQLDEYGFQFGGVGKTLLEGAYADLQVKWKEAANLGALTGPDLQLIMDAVKPSTGFRGIGASVLGGGTSGIQTGVEQLITNIDQEGNLAYSQLTSRDPKYAKSEYVQGLGIGFSQEAGLPGERVLQRPLEVSGGLSTSAVSPNNSLRGIQILK